MAPKQPAALTPAQASLLARFEALSIDPARADAVVRNAKQAAVASSVLAPLSSDAAEWEGEKGKLLVYLITQSAKTSDEGRAVVVQAISEGRLARSDQVAGEFDECLSGRGTRVKGREG